LSTLSVNHYIILAYNSFLVNPSQEFFSKNLCEGLMLAKKIITFLF